MGGGGRHARHLSQAATASSEVFRDAGCVLAFLFYTTCPVSCLATVSRMLKLITLPAGERPGIVVLTIGLEESLPKLPGVTISSKLWSPYRLPLIRFLNQYPAERWDCCTRCDMLDPGHVACQIRRPHALSAVESWHTYTNRGLGYCSVSYFIEATTRLANDSYFKRLLDIIRKPEAAPLLESLSNSEDKLLGVFSLDLGSGKFVLACPCWLTQCFKHVLSCDLVTTCYDWYQCADNEATMAAQLNCIHLMYTMSKLLPDWLPSSLFSIALQRWRSSEFKGR
jgi:hypothetical protein